MDNLLQNRVQQICGKKHLQNYFSCANMFKLSKIQIDMRR